MKKLIKLVTIVFSLLLITTPTFAIESNRPSSQQEILMTTSYTVANKYIENSKLGYEDNWMDVVINEEIPLYDFNGGISGYLYTLINTKDKVSGYMTVVNIEGNPQVIEAAPRNKFKYLSTANAGSKINYVGPLSYYVEEKNGNFRNLSNNTIVNRSEVAYRAVPLTTNALTKTASISPQATTIEYISNYSTMPWIGQNTSTSCASASAAMMLSYYNENGKSGITGELTGTALRDSILATFGGTVSNNTYKTKLPTYVTGNGYSATINFWTADNAEVNKGAVRIYDSNYTQYKNEIINNRPAMVFVGKKVLSYLGSTTIHAVMGYGYKVVDTNNYMIVKDPNGGAQPTDVEILFLTAQDSTSFGIYTLFRTIIN